MAKHENKHKSKTKWDDSFKPNGISLQASVSLLHSVLLLLHCQKLMTLGQEMRRRTLMHLYEELNQDSLITEEI